MAPKQTHYAPSAAFGGTRLANPIPSLSLSAQSPVAGSQIVGQRGLHPSKRKVIANGRPSGGEVPSSATGIVHTLAQCSSKFAARRFCGEPHPLRQREHIEQLELGAFARSAYKGTSTSRWGSACLKTSKCSGDVLSMDRGCGESTAGRGKAVEGWSATPRSALAEVSRRRHATPLSLTFQAQRASVT